LVSVRWFRILQWFCEAATDPTVDKRRCVDAALEFWSRIMSGGPVPYVPPFTRPSTASGPTVPLPAPTLVLTVPETIASGGSSPVTSGRSGGSSTQSQGRPMSSRERRLLRSHDSPLAVDPPSAVHVHNTGQHVLINNFHRDWQLFDCVSWLQSCCRHWLEVCQQVLW
jgi:hypothetical protein